MALYWILLLGQTIGDAKIFSHVIPLFSPHVAPFSSFERLSG